jgi:hypothetical protein
MIDLIFAPTGMEVDDRILERADEMGTRSRSSRSWTSWA